MTGNFVMTWSAEDGRLISGVAKTAYLFNKKFVLPDVQFREITIDFESSEATLNQSETIVIFTPEVLRNAISSIR